MTWELPPPPVMALPANDPMTAIVMEIIGVEGRFVVIVLEQDHAFLGDVAGHRAVLMHGNGLVRGLIIKKAILHHGAEAADELVVNDFHRNFVVFDGQGKGTAEIFSSGHF